MHHKGHHCTPASQMLFIVMVILMCLTTSNIPNYTRISLIDNVLPDKTSLGIAGVKFVDIAAYLQHMARREIRLMLKANPPYTHNK